MTGPGSSRALTVLHVDHERGLGGGERQVLGLVTHLRSVGIRQSLAADPAGRIATDVARLGIAVVPLAIRNHLDLLAGRRLARLLARDLYDIVHFHTARAHAMAAFLGAPRGEVRVVTRRMDYRLRGGWYTRRLYNREVQAVVAISDGVREALIASGVEPDRIHVIPSGVETEAFAPSATTRAAVRADHGVAPDARVLLAVGALERRKGHDVLLAALATLDDPRLVLWCAGEGSARGALEAQCRALDLDARVRFLGRVDDVGALLAAADVLVMPSRQEGLGVAVLEAMAAGLPVIASRVGGLPEAVADGVTGLLVAPDDVTGLAVAIARLASDRALASRLGAAGAARVRVRFTMAAMADATLALYSRLAERTPTAALGSA